MNRSVGDGGLVIYDQFLAASGQLFTLEPAAFSGFVKQIPLL